MLTELLDHFSTFERTELLAYLHIAHCQLLKLSIHSLTYQHCFTYFCSCSMIDKKWQGNQNRSVPPAASDLHAKWSDPFWSAPQGSLLHLCCAPSCKESASSYCSAHSRSELLLLRLSNTNNNGAHTFNSYKCNANRAEHVSVCAVVGYNLRKHDLYNLV